MFKFECSAGNEVKPGDMFTVTFGDMFSRRLAYTVRAVEFGRGDYPGDGCDGCIGQFRKELCKSLPFCQENEHKGRAPMIFSIVGMET